MLIHIIDILRTLPIEKAPVAFNNGGPATNINSTILPPADSADKNFKTMQAQAALAGHRLQRHGNVFLASRWGHTKQLDSLAAVAAWVDHVGGSTHV